MSHLGCIALLCIPLLTAFSCDLFPGEKGGAEGPGAVSADIVWSRETGSGDLQPMAIRDGVLYYAESPTTIDGFTALDPVNGEIVWQDAGRGTAYSRPQFFSNGKVGWVNGNHFFLYNADFSFDKYVTFDDPGYLKVSEVTSFGTTVYLGTRDYGLVRFDIATDFYEQGGAWYVQPETLYANPAGGDAEKHWLPPTVQDGVLYGGVNPVWGQPGTFFAINLANKSVLWENSSPDPGITRAGLRAWSDWPLTYLDGRLIVLDPIGFGIIDSATGQILVDRGVYYAGGEYAGGYFYDGKVYYTNGSTDENEDTPNNIICMDTTTGEAVWMNSFPGSHGSNPVCYEGITYVFSQDCLRVLDARTGKLLGVDDDIRGDIWQIANIVTYGDLAIVKYMGRIYAVRMNFRTDGKGGLWKAN